MDPTRIANIRIISNRLLFALGVLVAIFASVHVASHLVDDKGPILPFVLIWGAVGSFVSLQRRLKTLSEDDLHLLSQSYASIWLNPITGALLAAILYMLFVGNLLSGSLFPAFNASVDAELTLKRFQQLAAVNAVSAQDYAKLIFWSFLAGFSESFVTNILGNFEANALASESSRNATDSASSNSNTESNTP